MLVRNHAIDRARDLLNHRSWRGITCIEATLENIYVKNKRIIPYYAKQIRSSLVLPITDVNKMLQSIQFIKPNGRKQFKKNTTFKNGMMYLSEEIRPNDIIRICEGYATSCSVYETVGPPVVCAFNADNLINVARELRIKYPLNQIHICGDNDQFKKENSGLKFALAAAKNCDGKVFIPNFKDFDVSGKPTDWNDLFCLAGIEEVERQLLNIK